MTKVVMTFEWEEITDELLEKVVCFSYEKTIAGFGYTGQEGCLHAVMENGQEYDFGLNECPSANHEFEIIDRLLGECPAGLSDHEIYKWRADRYLKMTRTGEIGKWRWEHSLEGNIFIRDDYYGRIYLGWMKQREKKINTPATEAAKNILDPQGKLPKMVLAATQTKRDKYKKG